MAPLLKLALCGFFEGTKDAHLAVAKSAPSKAGKARRAQMTAADRQELAKKAIAARWGKRKKKQ